VIKTQTGHYLEFEELKGIKLADKKGNIFHIDSTADTINIEALQTINLKAPNINLIATQNITTNAGMDIEEVAGGNKTTRVGLIKTLSVGLDYVTRVIGKMEVFVKGDYQSHTDKNRNVTGMQGVATHSDTTIKHHAKTEVQNNSAEKTNMF
jgi:hypothetical protein